MINYKIALKKGKSTILVEQNEVIYIKADYGCCKVILQNGKYFETYNNLKEIEKLISSHLFCRIHNSFIVNINFIESIIDDLQPVVSLNNGEKIFISRRRKQELLQKFIHL